jgi:DNA (cytosine-5)-methyltransferase 1
MHSADLTCASFFAGVGGIDLGFKEQGFRTIYANEFDAKARETFSLNFPHVQLDGRDIREVSASEVPTVDVIVGGFPCQAFSIEGYRQGFRDEKGRGTLFFELARIIEEKQPQAIFLENVKNLVNHDKGNTFKVILKTLEDLGYYVTYKVMNAAEFGNIPQGRERIYIVGFKDKAVSESFQFPEKIPLSKTVFDVIDFKTQVDEQYYYREDKHYYPLLRDNIVSVGGIYEYRRGLTIRENKSGVVPTLLASMGTGGNNVPLILTESGEIRKLTPRECFNTQGFPGSYQFPEKMANSHLYKQAGNSVAVPVVSRIAKQIKLDLESEQVDE